MQEDRAKLDSSAWASIDPLLGMGAALVALDDRLSLRQGAPCCCRGVYDYGRQLYDGLRVLIYQLSQDPQLNLDGYKEGVEHLRCAYKIDHHILGDRVEDTPPFAYVMLLGHMDIGKERFPELLHAIEALQGVSDPVQRADERVAALIIYAVLQFLKRDMFFTGKKPSVEDNAGGHLWRLWERIHDIAQEEPHVPSLLIRYKDILEGFLTMHRRAELTSEQLWRIIDPKPEDPHTMAALGAALFLAKNRNSCEGFVEGELLPRAKEDEWIRELTMHFAALAGAYIGFSRLPPSWKWPFLFNKQRQWMIPLCIYATALREREPSPGCKEIICTTIREISQAGYGQWTPGTEDTVPAPDVS